MYMEPLEDFYVKVSQTAPQKTNSVMPDMEVFNRDGFKNLAPNIVNMDEHEIAVTVKNYIYDIAKDIISGNIPYIDIFSNVNFINGFIRAINSIPINYDIRLACNKITYDYLTSDNAIPELKQKYLAISRIVNRVDINRIMSLGLDENTASYIVLCRYSSTKESVNIMRLNFNLYYKDPNVMTEQIVVWIYEKLFDRISPLFNATMFEVYNPKQEEEFGENFMEVYGVVGLACLDILNNMTSDALKRVLIEYYNEWDHMNRPRVRFSLRCLSTDYSHISRVVDSLVASGYNIP